MLHTKIVDSKKEKILTSTLKNLLKTLNLEHQFIFWAL